MGLRDSRRLRAVAAFLGPCLLVAVVVAVVAALEVMAPHRYLHLGLYQSAAGIVVEQLLRPLAVAALVALVLGLVWPALGARLGRWSIGLAVVCAGLVVVFGATFFLRGRLLAAGPDVYLIGVDTLRADHLGVYGYPRRTSPHLDAWAEGATVFDSCITATPRTTQSLASILTGRYPHRHGVRHLRDRLPDRELALAEVMKNAGYTTIAVIATGISQDMLDQGFDRVIDTPLEFTAEETVDRTLAALEEVPGKLFLFVFFRDPHMPYEPPGVRFDREYRGPAWGRLHYQGDKGKTVFENDFDPRLREHAIALYDSEIFHMDRQIGRLLEALDERSGGDDLTLFFSDHGESLGEHDYYYDHGDLLYQPGLRIPCIVEGIDLGGPRIEEVVRSVDLMPTLLGALGLPVRNAELDGVDLATDPRPRVAFSETGKALLGNAYDTGRRHMSGLEGRLRSLISGRTKLIYVPRHGGRSSFELYDLESDPGELDDLAGEVEAEELERLLLSWVAQDRRNWDRPEADLDDEEAERLRQLGYL